MDLLEIIGLVALLLAGGCVVGMVRNWNKPGRVPGGEPLLYLTRAGWLLAGFTVTAVIGSLAAWHLLGPGFRGRRDRFVIYIFAAVGVAIFLFGRAVLALFHVKVTREDAGMEGRGPPGSPRKGEMAPSLLGRTGVTITPLRPHGLVAVGGLEYQAVSEGTYVEAGETIRVLRIAGLTLQVRREPTEPDSATGSTV